VEFASCVVKLAGRILVVTEGVAKLISRTNLDSKVVLEDLFGACPFLDKRLVDWSLRFKVHCWLYYRLAKGIPYKKEKPDGVQYPTGPSFL